MIQILVGTNRPESRSLQVAHFIEPMYRSQGFKTHVMELSEIGMDQLNGTHYEGEKPEKVALAVDRLMKSEGMVVVCPEYNGSMPGALKYFIDHWKYPESFEHRPFCFIGLGGRFGGLRSVEHLQQIVGYRNGFIYPDRVFITNVWDQLKDGQIVDPLIKELLKKQSQGFCLFIKALQSKNLHFSL